jgi:hypothetical protein
METPSYSFLGARQAFCVTLTRNDETVYRIVGASRAIPFGDDTWLPEPGLEVGDNPQRNDGTLPSIPFKASLGSAFVAVDIDNGLYRDARVIVELTNANNPAAKDFQFSGRILGDVRYDIAGHVEFEILSLFAIPRDDLIRDYTYECWANFGDPKFCKIPTFPGLTVGSRDLYDVERLETIALGDRRRFRYGSDDTPEDYHNVILEATAGGITAASTPTFTDGVSDTITDGGVTWTVRNAWARYAQVGTILDATNILLTNYVEPRASVDSWLTPGRLIVRSGYCKNMSAKIRAFGAGDVQIEMEQPFALLMAEGDWIDIAPDCTHLPAMCDSKYNNKNNYRGWDHNTGTKVAKALIIPGVTEFPGPTDDPTTTGGGGGGGGGGGDSLMVEFLDGDS